MPKPSDYPIHPYLGVRFYVATYGHKRYVCGGNGELLCVTITEEPAEMIAKALCDVADAEIKLAAESTGD